MILGGILGLAGMSLLLFFPTFALRSVLPPGGKIGWGAKAVVKGQHIS